jgi:hypothetical protein
MELLLVVGCLIIGFYTGWHLHGAVIIHKTNKILDEMEKQADKELETELMQIKIEKYNDTLFVYELATDKFLAQGKTRDELEDNLTEMFPGKKFGATNENLREVGFLS